MSVFRNNSKWFSSRPWFTTVLIILSLLVLGIFQYCQIQWKNAQSYVKKEKYTEAKSSLDFCLKIWPNNIEVNWLCARNSRKTGDLKTAEKHLNKCLELQSGASEKIQLEFLLIRVQSGEVDELSTTLFDLIEKGHPDFREILNTISSTFIFRLRYKPAYACLSKWIELEPQYSKPYYWRGLVSERLSNQKAASTDYHKAIEIEPDMIPARLRIAEMLLEDKQAPEAYPHLERLIKLAPNDYQVQARLGICQFLMGDSSEARKLMESAIKNITNDPALLVTMANLEMQDNRAESAEKYLRTVLKEDRADTEALFVLVSALQIQGRTKEADETLAEYNKAKVIVDKINDFLKDKADLPTTTAEEYSTVGQLFLEIGRNKLGVYWLEKALDQEPRCQSAHIALADYYDKKGDAKSASVHRSQVRSNFKKDDLKSIKSDKTPESKSP